MFFLWSSRLFGADYIFQPLAVPEARYTQPMGINDLGDVVGVYADCEFCQVQAFLFSDGQYYDIGVEGASRVTPFGINKHGVIAGTLVNAGQFAFIMDDDKTTVLDKAVRADGINNNHNPVVVGYQSTAKFNQAAYLWQAGRYVPLVNPDLPGILGSAATGVNDRGDIVGYYFFDNGPCCTISQGFVIKSGKLSHIELIPLGINSDGVIVGLAGAGNDGAVLENGVVTLIKYPGSSYTQVHGINNKGVIVGYHQTDGRMVGFIATPFAAMNANGKKKATDLMAQGRK